ncbi:MAG TPA: ribonuclease T2 [Bryobacteraceae bacterium]|nr:ribonuclease T2 [Bryobacteraceae bacterium]HPT25330.1 ribonuclease T2 [Bryobacteraceae bacterium]
MRTLTTPAIILACFAAALCAQQSNRRGEPGKFDSYILALSWSPGYCDGRPEDPQCAPGRQFSFVVHGLWPQYANGRWPESCSTDQGLPNADRMLDIMPSRSLIRHEWNKHGTCSGLDAEGYFKLLRRTYESVRIPQKFKQLNQWILVAPAELKREFIAANPGMKESMLSVQCSRNVLSEVRICMGKDMKPEPCVSQPECRAEKMRVPPVR